MSSCEQERLGQNCSSAFVVPLLIVHVESNTGNPRTGIYEANESITLFLI